MIVALATALIGAVLTPTFQIVFDGPVQKLVGTEPSPEVEVVPNDVTVRIGESVQFRLEVTNRRETRSIVQHRWSVGTVDASQSRAARCQPGGNVLTCMFVVPGHHTVSDDIILAPDGRTSATASIEAVGDKPYLLLVPVVAAPPEAAPLAMRALLYNIDWPRLQEGLSTTVVLLDPDTNEPVLAALLLNGVDANHALGEDAVEAPEAVRAQDNRIDQVAPAPNARTHGTSAQPTGDTHLVATSARAAERPRPRIGFSVEPDVLPVDAWRVIVERLTAAGFDVVAPPLANLASEEASDISPSANPEGSSPSAAKLGDGGTATAPITPPESNPPTVETEDPVEPVVGDDAMIEARYLDLIRRYGSEWNSLATREELVGLALLAPSIRNSGDTSISSTGLLSLVASESTTLQDEAREKESAGVLPLREAPAKSSNPGPVTAALEPPGASTSSLFQDLSTNSLCRFVDCRNTTRPQAQPSMRAREPRQVHPAEQQRRAAERQANMNVQGALNGFGFDVGQLDGALGPRSRAAISQYQAYMGYPPSGYLDENQRAILLGSYSRLQAGEGVRYPQVIAAEGTRGLLRAFNDPNSIARYGVAPTVSPEAPQAPAPNYPGTAPQGYAGRATPSPPPHLPAATTLAPLEAVGAAPSSMADRCEMVQLTTRTNQGVISAADMSDPAQALSEQFCAARDYAMSVGQTLSTQVNASGDQLAQSCEQIATAMDPVVAALAADTPEAVAAEAAARNREIGIADATSASTYGQICLGLGYRQDNAEMALAANLMLVGAGYMPFGEMLGHHLREGFGVPAANGAAVPWYNASLAALDGGAQPMFLPTKSADRAAVIRAAVESDQILSTVEAAPVVKERTTIPASVVRVEQFDNWDNLVAAAKSEINTLNPAK